jgi:ribosome-associated protein
MPSDEDLASGPLRVTRSVVIPAHELTWRFSRSSGPGGQGVNTTDSRAELIFDLAASSALPPELKARALARLERRLTNGQLAISAAEFRSQLRNRQAARDRLAALLAEAIAAPPRARRATKPSKAALPAQAAAQTAAGVAPRGRRPSSGVWLPTSRPAGADRRRAAPRGPAVLSNFLGFSHPPLRRSPACPSSAPRIVDRDTATAVISGPSGRSTQRCSTSRSAPGGAIALG